MNSFERFGIKHLSPSSLNAWRAAPGLWALRYLANQKDESPGMWRGTAVENGLTALLRRQSLEDAIEHAHRSYDANAAERKCDLMEAAFERELIAPMVKAASFWNSPGELNAAQIKVEYWFDPIPIPVIGYLDFAFEGTDVDLKSTKRIPSAPSAEHIRQVSLYRAARNKSGGLLYVSDKKHAYYNVNDEAMNDALAELRAAALSLNNFLARMDSREDALRSLPFDYENFRAPKTKVKLTDILLAG